MRIAHGKTGLRITMTQADFDELTDKGQKGASLSLYFNGLGNPEDFLELSHDDLPKGVRYNITHAGDTSVKAGWPWLLNIPQSKSSGWLARLPLFGPEEVRLTRDLTHSLAGWVISKPTMSIPYTDKKFEKPQAKTNKWREQGKVRGRAPNYPAASPAGPIVAATLDLRGAVALINATKDEMGESLVLEIDKATGRLTALVQFS